MELTWADAWRIGAVLGTAALVLALVTFGFTRRVNRAFALFLAVGIGHGITTLVHEIGSADAARLAARLYPYFNLSDELALLWFLSVFTGWPRRLHQGPWMAIIFVAIVTVLLGAYMIDADLYFVGPGGRATVLWEAEGPLALVDNHLWTSHTLAALALAVSYFRADRASRSTSTILVSAALTFGNLSIIMALSMKALFGQLPVPGTVMTAWSVHAAVGIALAAYVGWQAIWHEDPGARATSRRYAVLLVSLLVLGLMDLWVPLTEIGVFDWLSPIGTLLLLYSLLRHQLFGLDRKVRFVLSRSTVAAAFVAVFFLASEGAQLVFGREDQVVGLLAAGALVFVMAPLQRAAERFAERAVPETTQDPPTIPTEKEEMYRDAVRLALRDRTLTRAEERHLFRLARGLGLTPDRAHEILVEIENEGGPSA